MDAQFEQYLMSRGKKRTKNKHHERPKSFLYLDIALIVFDIHRTFSRKFHARLFKFEKILCHQPCLRMSSNLPEFFPK